MTIELAIITGEVLSLGDPLLTSAKDGRRLLVRGPYVSSAWPHRTPAEHTAWTEDLPVIALSVRQVLDVAAGSAVDTRTWQGEPARVRLATRIELMVFNRQARTELAAILPAGCGLPEPLSAARAAELAAPVVVPPEMRRQLLERSNRSARAETLAARLRSSRQRIID